MEESLDGHMVSVSGQLDLHYVRFSELVNPQTLRTEVRFVERQSDFHKLARFLETRVGAAVPGYEGLLERADARARDSLVIAARLCMHRIAEQRQLQALGVKLDAAPWSGSHTRVRTHPETLLPGDLVRALLVCEPERIAGTLALGLLG